MNVPVSRAVAVAMCRFWWCFVIANQPARFDREQCWKHYFAANNQAGNREAAD